MYVRLAHCDLHCFFSLADSVAMTERLKALEDEIVALRQVFSYPRIVVCLSVNVRISMRVIGLVSMRVITGLVQHYVRPCACARVMWVLWPNSASDGGGHGSIPP